VSTLTSRLLGLLAALWTVHHFIFATTIPAEFRYLTIPWAVWSTLWAVVALLLLLAKRPRSSGGLVLLLAATELVTLQQWHQYGVILMAWIGLILLVLSTNSEKDVTLCLRVLATTVYVFGGLAKLQPSWLAGENLLYLARTRPQVGFLESAPQSVLIGLAVAAAVTEIAVGIALWTNARRYAAIVGVALHVSLVYSGTMNGVLGFIDILVLNLGLVLLYVAFWQPIPTLAPAPALDGFTDHDDQPARRLDS